MCLTHSVCSFQHFQKLEYHAFVHHYVKEYISLITIKTPRQSNVNSSLFAFLFHTTLRKLYKPLWWMEGPAQEKKNARYAVLFLPSWGENSLHWSREIENEPPRQSCKISNRALLVWFCLITVHFHFTLQLNNKYGSSFFHYHLNQNQSWRKCEKKGKALKSVSSKMLFWI